MREKEGERKRGRGRERESDSKPVLSRLKVLSKVRKDELAVFFQLMKLQVHEYEGRFG